MSQIYNHKFNLRLQQLCCPYSVKNRTGDQFLVQKHHNVTNFQNRTRCKFQLECVIFAQMRRNSLWGSFDYGRISPNPEAKIDLCLNYPYFSFRANSQKSIGGNPSLFYAAKILLLLIQLRPSFHVSRLISRKCTETQPFRFQRDPHIPKRKTTFV